MRTCFPAYHSEPFHAGDHSARASQEKLLRRVHGAPFIRGNTPHRNLGLLHIGRTTANFDEFVMWNCYAIAQVILLHDGSDPNGIRTRFKLFASLRDSVINTRYAAR